MFKDVLLLKELGYKKVDDYQMLPVTISCKKYCNGYYVKMKYDDTYSTIYVHMV